MCNMSLLLFRIVPRFRHEAMQFAVQDMRGSVMRLCQKYLRLLFVNMKPFHLLRRITVMRA